MGDAGIERWVVILAGGVGSRFWPASTPHRPKQFLPLTSERPLILETLDRAERVADVSRVLIVSGERLRPLFQRYLPDLPDEALLLEPHGRGTAAALAWAARGVLDRCTDPRSTVMVSLHSDHLIRPTDRFLGTIDRAIGAAGRLGRLLTIGVLPARPATGYGYVQVGRSLEAGVVEVERFVEKPDRRTAERYLSEGGYLWNSGIFVWRPDVLMDELGRHTPELAEHLDLLQTDVASFYDRVPPLSIDRGLLERTSNIAVVEADFEWDDVGAWASLARVRQTDERGNVGSGAAHAIDCDRTIVWAEDGPVVAWGLEEMVVARASGITFVTTLDRAAELKDLLDALPESLRAGPEET